MTVDLITYGDQPVRLEGISHSTWLAELARPDICALEMLRRARGRQLCASATVGVREVFHCSGRQRGVTTPARVLSLARSAERLQHDYRRRPRDFVNAREGVVLMEGSGGTERRRAVGTSSSKSSPNSPERSVFL